VATRTNHRPTGDETANDAEQALAHLLHVVLSPDERQLLRAFDAIRDPRLRQSLVEVALAAAGLTETEPPDPVSEDTHGPGPRDTLALRRVRRSLLRPRAEKG
jgi:hypothetical protein